MKIIFTFVLTFFFLFSSANSEEKTLYQNLSPELKGAIGGGSATGISSIIFGLSIAGVTAILPLTIVGSSVGYLSVKANKKYKNLKSKKNKK